MFTEILSRCKYISFIYRRRSYRELYRPSISIFLNRDPLYLKIHWYPFRAAFISLAFYPVDLFSIHTLNIHIFFCEQLLLDLLTFFVSFPFIYGIRLLIWKKKLSMIVFIIVEIIFHVAFFLLYQSRVKSIYSLLHTTKMYVLPCIYGVFIESSRGFSVLLYFLFL